MVYIPESNLPNLAKYRYKSASYSYLAQFFSKFLWEPLVCFFPDTLAPNLITLIGLLFMSMSYFIMLPFDQTFTSSPPPLILFISGVFIFIYQTLDGCDGKQARRLELSSSLGMLMDHGCDSLSCSLMILVLTQGLGLGVTNDVLILCITIQTVFFLTHWEEYHIHCHRTQMFNWGVTEVQWIYILLLWATGVFGAEIWQKEAFGVKIVTWMVYTNVVIGGIVAGFMVLNAVQRDKNAIWRLAPMIMMNFSLWVWFGSEMMNAAVVVICVHGLVYAKLNSKLMICSVAGMEFGWFDLDVMVELVFVVQDRYWRMVGSEIGILVIGGFCLVRYLQFIFGVVEQVAEYLKVPVFKVKF